jgi:hypothetical protein
MWTILEIVEASCGDLGELGNWETKSHGRQLPMGHSPPATDEGYDISRLVLLSEAYTSRQLPDIKRIDKASGVVLIRASDIYDWLSRWTSVDLAFI